MRNLLAASALAWAIGSVRIDGSPLMPYPYQASLLADRSPRIVVLKARQVGITTTVEVREAHAALYVPGHVSLIVSKDREAASEVVEKTNALYDELDHPPRRERESARELRLENGSRIVAQPATAKAGRGLRADSVVLDEFAFQEYDTRIYRAVLPTLSRGGRLTVISTPNGQANLYYRLWHGLEGGEWSRHRVHWRDCPVFDDAWYERERPKFTAADWASEYDLDFLVSGLAAFDPGDVDAMRDGWIGLQPPQDGRRYVSAWDVGRRRDPTVGITLDATEKPYQVVAFARMLRAPYAQTQAAIDARAEAYGGKTLVESNSIGDPVIEALNTRVTPFNTGQRSKGDALALLVRLIEQGELKCGVEHVLGELKSYQWEDQGIVQDCVIALAIAAAGAQRAPYRPLPADNGASGLGRLRTLPAVTGTRGSGPVRSRLAGLPYTTRRGGERPPWEFDLP